MPASEAAESERRVESLGYSALWIAETIGRHPFMHAAWLLANTSELIVATGIASIYHQDPGGSFAARNTLAVKARNRNAARVQGACSMSGGWAWLRYPPEAARSARSRAAIAAGRLA